MLLTPNQQQHIEHYYKNMQRPSNINKMNVEQVLKKAQDWTKKLVDNSKNVVELPKSVELKADLGDGKRLVRLRGKDAFEYEGREMGHCAGSYDDNGKGQHYSIRDHKNRPHCTMEVRDNRIIQLKGKANSKVASKYIPYVFKALEHLQVAVNETEMRNIGLIKVSNKVLKLLNTTLEDTVPTTSYQGQTYIRCTDKYWRT